MPARMKAPRNLQADPLHQINLATSNQQIEWPRREEWGWGELEAAEAEGRRLNGEGELAEQGYSE